MERTGLISGRTSIRSSNASEATALGSRRKSSASGSRTKASSKSGRHSNGERKARTQGFSEDTALDLYTWGYGGQGALGNAAFRDELEPFLVSSLRAHGGALLVACGFDHTCCVTGDLRARAWGRAAEGQLGIDGGSDGSLIESPRGGGCVLTPTLVGICDGEDAATVQAIACGGMHTLLLTMPRSTRDDALVFGCGRGEEGQLGTGPTGRAACVPAFAAVSLPSQLPPVVVAAGGLHSAALSSHGHVFMWGEAGCGQLGLPRAERAAPELKREAPSPTLQPASAPPAPPAPSTSTSVTRAVTASDSAAAGQASHPRLLASTAFEGRAELEAKVPITVSAADEGGRTFVVRGRRTPPLQVSNIACGQYHTACCTLDGELFAWGLNRDGQLGLGDSANRQQPCRVPLPHDGPCVQVACGGRHMFVLGAYGEVSSCGCNSHGQLGQGSSRGKEPLRRLVEVEALSDERVVQLACGGAHSAAVTADGHLYTWGKNANGQLGHGDVSTLDEPTRVQSIGQRAAWVACGGAHTACLVRLGEAMVDDGRGGEGGVTGSTARSSGTMDSRRSQDLSGMPLTSERYATGRSGDSRRSHQLSNRTASARSSQGDDAQSERRIAV